MKTRTMKVLDRPGLLSVAKTTVEEVTSLDLQRGMYDNVDVVTECFNVHSLFLSRNHLTTFGIDARKLWKVDLSHNALTDVGALANYAALGFVDVSHNDLGPEELAKLRGVHIVSLRTAANPKLVALPHYRASLIWLLPDVWVLDDRFVTWREREDAQAHFSLGPGKDSALQALVGQGGDMVWRSSSDAGDGAADLLQSLTQEPMRPALRDRFRLERLLHIYNAQNALEAEFLRSSAASGSGFKGRGRHGDHRRSGMTNSVVTDADMAASAADGFTAGGSGSGGGSSGGGGSGGGGGGSSDEEHLGGPDPWTSADRQRQAAASFLKWTPPTHTEAIGRRRLSAREQVDLVLLLNAVHEFGVPRGLVAQALAVHFGGRLLANVMRDLAQHPECVFRANTFHVRFANIRKRDAAVGTAAAAGRRVRKSGGTEAAGAVAGAERAAEEHVEELWQTMDDRAGLETHLQASAAKPRVGLGLATLARRRASHAAVLLSRAPAFPSPLLCTTQTKADAHLERCLQPLLHAARMTVDDLTFAVGAAERAVSVPRYVLHSAGAAGASGSVGGAAASGSVGEGGRTGEGNGGSREPGRAPDSLEMFLVSPKHRPAFATTGDGGTLGGTGAASGGDPAPGHDDGEDDDSADAVFLTGDGAGDEDYSALDDLPVEFFAQQAATPPTPSLHQSQRQQQRRSPPPARALSPRLLATAKLDPGVTGQRGRSTQRLYTKQPAMGEQVEIGFLARGVPHRVVARIKRTDETALHLLSQDKRVVKCFQSGDMRVAKADVYYDPRGVWRHRSAVAMRTLEKDLTATVPALHRNPAGQTTRSGAHAGANVPNAEGIPASLLAHHATHHEVNTDALQQQQQQQLRHAQQRRPMKASGVTAYTVNGKWDSHFVLAPASVVQAQNTFAQLRRHRPGGDGSAGPGLAAAWSRLRDDHVPTMQLPPGLLDGRSERQLRQMHETVAAMAQTPVHVTEPLWQRHGQQRKTYRDARHQSKWSDVRDKPVSMLPADFVNHMRTEMKRQQQRQQQRQHERQQAGDKERQQAGDKEEDGGGGSGGGEASTAGDDDEEESLLTETETGTVAMDEHDLGSTASGGGGGGPSAARSVPYGRPALARTRTTRVKSMTSLKNALRRKHNLLPEVGGQAFANGRRPESMSVASLSSSLIQAPGTRQKLESMLKMPKSFRGYQPPRMARRKPFGSLGI